jgi:glutathione synthase/RimK-type ligase-like ATP-grasp enzyme
MRALVVTDNVAFWKFDSDVEIVPSREYLTGERFIRLRQAHVFNLCRSYAYQSVGYYVSLLAEARGHRPIPSVSTMQDLRLPPVVRVVSRELEDLINRSLADVIASGCVLDIYFGRSVDPQHARLARALYNYFPAPLLRARFERNEEWDLHSIRPVATNEIPGDHHAFVNAEASRYFGRPHLNRKPESGQYRFDLAILVNPDEDDSPSDDRAIGRFARAANSVGIDVELIGRDDYGRLAEFDALFIRETTRVNHHTYRFARRAESEGLVVIDAPGSILRCGNKVYLAEVMARNGVPVPKTLVVDSDNARRVSEELGFPCVLKRPDSSFSAGVVRADDAKQLEAHLKKFFSESDLIVAQEYVPSSFDWRVGVLESEVLYACRYHMVEGHWQIQKSGRGGWRRYGKVEAVELDSVPPQVLEAGVKSASLIGDDLYGVDVKQVGDRFMVMEVNDNPSIEAGVEDAVAGDQLYLRIMRSFLRRLEARGRSMEPNSR